MIHGRAIHPRKKQKILERDNFKCVCCGVNGDFNVLEVDHIIPIKDGGSNDYHNLQTLCYKCNMDKYYKKNVTHKFLLNLTPLERLELIKKRLEEYKHLSHQEFKVVFTQDDLFKRLRIDLSYLNDLFYNIKGLDKKKETKSRFKEQRDRYIRYLYNNKDILDLNQEKIAKIGKITRQTVISSLQHVKSDNFEGI